MQCFVLIKQTESDSSIPEEGPARSRSQSVPWPACGDPLSRQEHLDQSTDSQRVWSWDPPSLNELCFHKVQTDSNNNTLNFHDSVQPWHSEVAKTTRDPVIFSKSRFPETCSIALYVILE